MEKETKRNTQASTTKTTTDIFSDAAVFVDAKYKEKSLWQNGLWVSDLVLAVYGRVASKSCGLLSHLDAFVRFKFFYALSALFSMYGNRTHTHTLKKMFSHSDMVDTEG